MDKMTYTRLCVIVLLAIAVSLTAVAAEPEETQFSHGLYLRRRRCSNHEPLTCYLQPASDSNVTGLISLREVQVRSLRGRGWRSRRCGVLVSAAVHGLTPGFHGFHIHTYGDVRASGGSSTGGHFTSPFETPVAHGLPDSEVRHWGDFGNLIANASGIAVFSHVDEVITLRDVIGRAFVVHAEQDKGPAEQPSGASGARQASCVIGYANPEL